MAYTVTDMADDPHKANQLHGHVALDGKALRVSFIEDAYFTVFPAVEKTIGGVVVQTEEVSGLYHRRALSTCLGQVAALEAPPTLSNR